MDSISGMALADTGRPDVAAEHLDRSIAAAEKAGDVRWLAYALSLRGRLETERGELERAHATLSRSLQMTLDDGWLMFVPWPEALLGEVELAMGDRRQRRTGASTTRTPSGCTSTTRAGKGCRSGASGSSTRAPTPPLGIARLDHARRRSLDSADGYRWVGAHALDALCALAIEQGDPRAGTWSPSCTPWRGARACASSSSSAYRHEAALGRRGRRGGRSHAGSHGRAARSLLTPELPQEGPP